VGACLALLPSGCPKPTNWRPLPCLAEVAVPFPAVPAGALDVVGTGGDGASTANLSTLSPCSWSSWVCLWSSTANRAATSVCGSADLMEALGYDLSRATSDLARDLEARNFAFLFAPPSIPCWAACGRSAGAWASPTIFNLLGPLLNPGLPPLQVLGVAREDLLVPMAGALARGRPCGEPS